MLPPALVSVYRKYKKHTNSIASWLASTAKECGYPADLLSNPPAPKQPAPRLKGKARAEAKKKAKVAPQESTPQNEGPRYIIEIKDFVPLAECISAYKKPALSVPAKKVREVLKPHSDPVGSGSSKEAETLTNKFKEVEVYHPSEKFLNAKDIERPGPANNDDVIYEADAGDSVDEAFFAYKLLCEDLNDIRTFITYTWEMHIEAEEGGDSIDPGMMAVVTNTAIEFGSTLAEDVKPLLEKHGGIKAMADDLMSGFLIDQEVDMNKFREQVAKGSVNEKVYAVMSHCCYHTRLSIETLAQVPWKGSAGIYPDGTFSVLDPDTGGEDKSMSQRLTEEQVILAELWTEAMALVYQVPDYPFSDEFIGGVKEFEETKQVPFSVIFAGQVILDVTKSSAVTQSLQSTLFSSESRT
ncbi:uncharacterized protein FFUJ_14798 [Fusarium fujikuroi IMI 58289]|uniref:DUF6604 domain-containing protein n=1 Tax=Gibberella fujikuroi (strain CBS 195.34 / IMI 58289 / NRRL A-6831) TaxID=1279085 RepID=S0DZD2_GIBF5|nr:uncharacterized protein FFUJ_14798 [Fusarium fujikuroi IMI 58289]KLP05292.1 uncharacterized protein LW94_13108 [Fusarium fujikuroi]CCT67901.1 uncharacterized protein FFUJ_14798 [Fusarium fujikuroi IMI 58289]SCO22232.1 uncharacterized protein FFM5_12945 [Fusarium fujikuroi]